MSAKTLVGIMGNQTARLRRLGAMATAMRFRFASYPVTTTSDFALTYGVTHEETNSRCDERRAQALVHGRPGGERGRLLL